MSMLSLCVVYYDLYGVCKKSSHPVTLAETQFINFCTCACFKRKFRIDRTTIFEKLKC